MMLAGDELSHTQQGNNNAYCQDNEVSWLDWHDDELVALVRGLIAIRRSHPVFRRPRFFRGVATSEQPLKDITWFSPEGREMTQAAWEDPQRRCIGALLGGDTGDRFISLHGYPELDDTFLILINGHADPVEFVLPATGGIARWTAILDTAVGEVPPRRGTAVPAQSLTMVGRSLVLLVGDPDVATTLP
jgi:glycogen operon protein